MTHRLPVRACIRRLRGSGSPWRTLLLAGVVLAGLAGSSLRAQQQFTGTCAQVRIEIQQELALERIGFEATLTVTNNDGSDSLTDFFAELTFENPQLSTAEQKNDASGLFFVQPPEMTNINRVDGTGVIGPTKTAVIRWFIIPTVEAGGEDPAGLPYNVGVRIGAKIRGEDLPKTALFVIPDQITVLPEPLLKITYFQPRDVQGDDPFTPEVESPIPFTLGVLVKNIGFGPARKLRIDSAQPKIVENLRGLILTARLLGVRVDDSPLNEKTLQLDFGDLPPQTTIKGAWDMITSLSGEFVEFNASYTHAPELGGELTSVIDSVDAHFITAEVLNDSPGRDEVLDFLADAEGDDRIPDTLFESEGNELPVNHLTDVVVNPFEDANSFTVDVNANISGWGFIRVNDPGQARRELGRVVRSDGKVINPNNVFTNFRFRQPDNARLAFLNIFDKFDSLGNYTYSVSYTDLPPDDTPPETRLLFSGEVREVAGKFIVNRDTQLFFQSEDDSPVSIVRSLNGGEFVPAIPFKVEEPGEYTLAYFATDDFGNEETTKIATVVLPSGAPAIAAPGVVSDSIVLTGDTLSVRPGLAVLEVDIDPSEVPLNATIEVFEGVKAFPRLAGVPVSPTPATDAGIDVLGQQVDYYQYSLNGGAWSAEAPAGQPIALSGLTSGVQTLRVLARSQYGDYPDAAEALEVSWTVSASAPDWQLTGAPTVPSLENGATITVAGADLELYRWTIDDGFFRAEAAPDVPIELANLNPGAHTLALVGRRTGDAEFPDLSTAQEFSWEINPAYGTDFADRRQVLEETIAGVENSQLRFEWDGRDDAGAFQNPGWYTVLITVDDGLGNAVHTARPVRISDLSGNRRTLVEDIRGPVNPQARGDWAVWQESATGANNIAAVRVGDSNPSPFAITSETLSQENPQTDGRYVVWQARRDNGAWDVRMADLEAPGTILELTATDGFNETRPAIDWPWVVYEVRPTDQPDAPSQVEAMNVDTGEVFSVLAGVGDQLNPSVHAGRVVWRDDRHPSPEIYFADLETGESRRITDNAFGQFFPQIRGNWIVWQDNRNLEVGIFGYNLLAGREVQLTNTPENEARPFLEHGWMLYEEDAYGNNVVNFRILELSTGRSVPLTRSGAAKARGSLAGSVLVWQDGEPGQTAVEIADVPALQPVFNNYNAIAVTPDLAGRFGSAFALLQAWNTEVGITELTRFTALAPSPALEAASIDGGILQGTDFPLVAGSFLWVRFPGEQVLDLGLAPIGALDLPAGVSAFSFDRFPFGYTAYRLVEQLGAANVAGLRVLDAETGAWQSLPLGADGSPLGPDFEIGRVSTVLVELLQPVNNFLPQ